MNKITSFEQIGGTTPDDTKNESAPWPEIQPFCDRLEREEYPISALPESIRAAVDEVLSFTQAPAAMVASCALSAVSLAIQGHVDVSRSPKLSGPTSLYVLVIAESGERKTTVDDYFKPAFADYEASERERLKPEIAKFRADLESWEAEKAGVKDKIRQFAKEGKDVFALKDRLREIEARKPQEIQIPRIVYRDITAEKLAENLSRNRPSAGIISDEAGSVFGSHSMQPDNCMKTLGMYNTLWSSGPLTLDRKTASSAIVESARLTISLQVQETTMRDFLEKAGAIARGSGFLARFLIAWPESTQGCRPWKDEPPSWPHLGSFREKIRSFLKKALPRSADGVLEPVKMTFSEEARKLWIQYYNGVEQSLRAGSEMGEIRDVASKSAENAARLAACFEAFENENETIISAKSMQSAMQIAYWHLTESRRFLGEIALPENKLNALRLERWLKTRCRELNTDRIRKSDAMQRGPLRDKEHLDPALELLRERGRARLVTAENAKLIILNPTLLETGVHE